jgi:uncharacterized protein YjbJ (UPF0337 family)
MLMHQAHLLSGMSVALSSPDRMKRFSFEEQTMADNRTNRGAEDQAEGFGKQAEGKIRNAVGGITGDTSEQLKGKAKDLEGKAQRKIGEAEDEIENKDY